jgi:long-chain acyl-CoA synthetase
MDYQDKPWLNNYKLGPYQLDSSLAPYPKEPLFNALENAAARYPNQTAVLYEGSSLKYRQLNRLVDRLAASLAAMGLKKGDRVNIYLPNCIEFVLSYWAVIKAGGAAVLTSTMHSVEGLKHELRTPASKMIICREDYLDNASAAAEGSQVERMIVTSTPGYNQAEVCVQLPTAAVEFGRLLEGSLDAPAIQIDPEEDLCELAFTGGATGIPKGVMLSHYNRACVIRQGLPWLMKPMLPGIAGKSSVLLSTPMSHAYGNFVHQSSVYLGLRLIILPDARDTNKMAAAIQEYRPFLIPGVPTQFMRLADAGLQRINSMFFSGSAPLPNEVAQNIRDKTRMPISEGYGLTETSTLTHMNLSGFSKITGFLASEKYGIGVPIPDTECKLVDPEDGETIPQGQPGEIVVRGPQVMRGYWPEPGSGLTPDGWLHTGDIAVMDGDGYFQLVDRVKDMVNVSGLKVYTTQVDEVLFKHPAVLMAASFGVPDQHIPGSERVMAVIQLKDDQSDDVDANSIKEFCRERLPPYAVPMFVEFREDLPLTVSEKVFKKALRDECIARLELDP